MRIQTEIRSLKLVYSQRKELLIGMCIKSYSFSYKHKLQNPRALQFKEDTIGSFGSLLINFNNVNLNIDGYL